MLDRTFRTLRFSGRAMSNEASVCPRRQERRRWMSLFFSMGNWVRHFRPGHLVMKWGRVALPVRLYEKKSWL